jgi:hypothetical protein
LAAPAGSSGSILIIITIIRGAYQVPVILGEGSWRIEVALPRWGGIPGEAPGGAASEGRRLPRPGHPRRQVRFPASPSFRHPSFRARSEVGVDQVRRSKGARGREGAEYRERAKKPKPAKTARERRRVKGNWREGNSPAWAKGRTNWRLNWCW